MSNATTPMMKQYQEAKGACPDALLLFRMGDFYEMFFDDAKTAARTLNLALTSRDKGEDATPMAGFPYHQLESYLGKLISAGFRVAVCEQVEDPKLAKGLVRREVTRVVTPGTVVDDALLDPRQSNYLAAVSPGDPIGIAWVEISTGRFQAAGFPPSQLADQLARLSPAECLLAESADPLPARLDEQMMVTRRPDWVFGWPRPGRRSPSTSARPAWKASVSLRWQGGHAGRSGGRGDPRLSQGNAAKLAGPRRSPGSLPGPQHAGDRRGQPAEPGDRPHDPRRPPRRLVVGRAGADDHRDGRPALADWVANPLIDAEAINHRLDGVEELLGDPALAADLRETLRRVYDVQRLLARVTTGRASPRDLELPGPHAPRPAGA
jgi:DNA mismatch repair protein MutS